MGSHCMVNSQTLPQVTSDSGDPVCASSTGTSTGLMLCCMLNQPGVTLAVGAACGWACSEGHALAKNTMKSAATLLSSKFAQFLL